MKHPALKSTLLGLSIAAVAIVGNVLTACSSTSQNQSTPSSVQATSSATANTGSKQMDSSMGSMDHGMDLGPADAQFDLRFIDGMAPHHQGAIAMAQEALQKAQHPEIKKLAQDIIDAQQKEIAEMKQWRTTWYPNVGNAPMAWHAKMGHSMAMSQDQMNSMMMNMDLGAADAEFDLRFINAMIPHHEGAVVMANQVLSKSQRPEVRQLAQDIIASQQAEINQMKQWRQAWYNQ
jgi:uncharacterized protein (DUF305 family)